MHARLEGVGAGTKALVGTKDPALCGLVADRIEAPAELTQALAGLLGARLQDVVVRDIARGMELLAELAAGKKGRATIVPLHAPYVAGDAAGAAGRSRGSSARLVDRASVRAGGRGARPLARGRRDRGAGPRPRRTRSARRGVRGDVVTLDGTVLHADGRVSGGHGRRGRGGDARVEARDARARRGGRSGSTRS